MAGALTCTLTTPEEKVFEGAVTFAVLPASDGELGILPRHAPLVGSLGCGELRLDTEADGRTIYFVDGGFLEVLDDQLSILAARAVPAGDLDPREEEARLNEIAAQQPAENTTPEAREEYARSLAAARARLRLAKRARSG